MIVAVIAAGWTMIPFIHHEGSRHSLLSAIAMIELTPALLCWPTAWLTWRVLASTPHDFDGPAVRTAALRSLCGGGLLCGYAAVVLYTNWHRLEPGFDDYNAFVLAVWVAVGGSIAATIPWITHLRRRVRGSATNRGWVDQAAKVLLASGIALALIAWAIAAFLFAVRQGTDAPPYPSLGWAIAYFLFFVLLQFASSGCFALGLLIELFRDRWHPILTAVGCAYFIPFWLIVAYNERLVLAAI
jgi:hypothetical protein